MRRAELVAGETYVTSQGRIMRVESPEPGYVLVAGDWVLRPQVRTRSDRQGRGFEEYPANRRIRVWVVGEFDGTEPTYYDIPSKAVEYPRNLLTLASYTAQHSQTAKAERVKDRERKEVLRVLKAAGLAKAEVDVDTRNVNLPIDDLLAVLTKQGSPS